jgi:hypothetical protein
MLLNYFVGIIVNWIARRYAHNATARSIGIWFYQENAGKRLLNAYNKLFMEAYFETCFCVFLGLHGFQESA